MERTIRLGALNIVTQPHSAAGYYNLLRAVRNRRKAARIRADRFGLISLMGKMPTNANTTGSAVDGLIGAFTQLDVDQDWINVDTGRKALDNEVAEVSIPRALRPNANFHRFRFYLKSHLLVFEIGNSGAKLTPMNAGRLFERLFSADPIIQQFGEISVTVWPSSDSIDEIVNHKKLKSLHLVINTPNPDDGADAEEEFKQRLEELRAKRLEQIVVAKRGQSLEPDEELIRAARVASTNGKVDAVAVSGNRRVTLSTTDVPFTYTHTFSTEGNTEENEFGIAAEIVKRQLRDGAI